jgi:uncharacterized membrane protein
MNTKKSLLVGAALTSLLAAGAFGSTALAQAEGMAEAAGQCHGVNACKGKGDCQGMGHECEGKNACKGKGWVKMSKDDCGKDPKGHWKPMPEKH